MARVIKPKQNYWKKVKAHKEALKYDAIAARPKSTTIVRRTKDGVEHKKTIIKNLPPIEKVGRAPERTPIANAPSTKQRKKSMSRLERTAARLNRNLPASEKWFQSLWRKHNFQDKYNKPFGPYIPDVINEEYKYIIEIDGSIHNTSEQQFKDKKKDAFYKRAGYQVFRISYDPNNMPANILQYEALLVTVLALRARG